MLRHRSGTPPGSDASRLAQRVPANRVIVGFETPYSSANRINFGRVTTEQADERRVQIQPSGNRTLKISDMNVQAPDFEVELVTVK